MRLGVLDVGSNTVHLLVVDAHPGARPLPAHSHKAELRLAELLDPEGAIGPAGVDRLVSTITDALRAAEDKGCEDVLAFATSAVREATNADEVLSRVRDETGVALAVLSGEEEARLTFLAARRWFGWSAGKLLVLDIGGGSLEVGYGLDEEPDAAVSLPLVQGASPRAGCPVTRRTPRPYGRCAATSAPASPGPSATSPGSGRPTTSSGPPRPSNSSPGSRAPRAPPKACTCSASSPVRPWRSGCRSCR